MPRMEVNFPGLAYELITFLRKDWAEEFCLGSESSGLALEVDIHRAGSWSVDYTV